MQGRFRLTLRGIAYVGSVACVISVFNSISVANPASSTAPATKPTTVAPIVVTSLTPYVVFQRSSANLAKVPIAGNLAMPGARVEAKATLMPPYKEGIDGKSTGFVAIAGAGGHDFKGAIDVASGGWYSITVRATDADGRLLGETSIEKVGVGEVFVAAGHSFCSNWNGTKPSKAADDRVATCADWTERPPSPPAFRHCDDPLRPGDENRASPWPAVGDALVSRLHVPVLVICTAMGGTTVEQWRKAADDRIDAASAYAACRLTLLRLTPYTGLRSVIWFGNENDLRSGPTPEVFSDNLRRLIARTRSDSGYPELPWLIAFDAYDPGVSRELGADKKLRRKDALDRGTEMVLQTVANTYDGPQTDDLGPEFRRSDGDHFNEAGLQQLAVRFSRMIVQAFFPPPVPEPQPTRLP